MQKHVMLDIETFGIASTSVVLSIGAVEFTLDGIQSSFYVDICPESCTKAGLTMDPRTVLWWLEQNEAARMKLVDANTTPLMAALSRLSQAFDWKGMKVWCNGANFDFPILANAYQAVDSRPPWNYYNLMDYRTLKNLVPYEVHESLRVRPTVAHNALADAEAQALTAIALMKHLKLEG